MGDHSDGDSRSHHDVIEMIVGLKGQIAEMAVTIRQLSDQNERLSNENARLMMLDRRDRDRVRFEAARSKRDKRRKIQDAGRFGDGVETRNSFEPLADSVDEYEAMTTSQDENEENDNGIDTNDHTSRNSSEVESRESVATAYSRKPKRKMSVSPKPAMPKKNSKLTFKKIVLEDGEQVVIPEEEVATTSALPAPARQPKFPPMILFDKDYDPLFISKLMTENEIEMRKPIRAARQGFEVFTNTPDEYRRLIRVCTAAKIKYVNWQLDEEKELRFVVKNVSTKMSVESIEEDLRLRGFPVTKVARMTTKSKGELPIITINATKNEKGLDLYNLRHINHLQVKVEAKRKSPDHRQCFRCQRWGHVSFRCQLDPRCLKCASNHQTFECTKQLSDSPKCVNCQGIHVASSYECPQHPRNIREAKEKRQRTLIEHSKVREGRSYASATDNVNLESKIEEIVTRVLAQWAAKQQPKETIQPPSLKPVPLEATIEKIVNRLLNQRNARQ